MLRTILLTAWEAIKAIALLALLIAIAFVIVGAIYGSLLCLLYIIVLIL